MRRFFYNLLPVMLIVITDPYKDLDYDKLNSYTIPNKVYRKVTIKVYCAEGHDDCHHEDPPKYEDPVEYTEDVPEDKYYDSIYKEPEKIFCYVCNPPQWLSL